MRKLKVLVTHKINIFTELSSKYPELDINYLENIEELEKRTDKDEIMGVVTILSDKVDETFLDKLRNLRVISNYAVGFNNIDIKSANLRGIKVGNTPNTLTHSTAELAMTLLLTLARKTLHLQEQVWLGEWKRWEWERFNGVDLRNKCIGIIGFGRIGQTFARMAHQVWNSEIIVWNGRWQKDHHKEDILNFPYKRVSEEEFFLKSQIVSLHCPLTEFSKGLINDDFINKMKNKFFFINTARGECHNEDSLLRGLEAQKILGIGLDVTNPEPMAKTSPLLSKKFRDKVAILPHIGSATDQTRKEMAIQCLENIRAGLKGEKLPYEVVLDFDS